MRKRHIVLIAVLVLILIGIVLLVVLLLGGGPTVYEIDVDSRAAWQKTVVRVAKGQRLRFAATGMYAFCSAGEECGPEGMADSKPYTGNWPVNGLVGLALIGRIGETGKPFLVGEAAEITAGQDGVLFLMVNDDILGENDGTLHVTVTRVEE